MKKKDYRLKHHARTSLAYTFEQRRLICPLHDPDVIHGRRNGR